MDSTNEGAAIARDPDIHCQMLDYMNFNIQHSRVAMTILYESFAQVGEEIGCHADWIRANKWLAKDKFNMKVTVKDAAKFGLPSEWVIKQGMFSGTKGTFLINTLLNLA